MGAFNCNNIVLMPLSRNCLTRFVIPMSQEGGRTEGSQNKVRRLLSFKFCQDRSM